MKIVLVGPGIMPIPPPGWGAVEILMWDYYQELRRIGHDVSIINTPNTNEIIEQVNMGNYDFAHVHYDVFYHILDKLRCPKIAITSHYPYIDQQDKYRNDHYATIFRSICNNDKHIIFALSEKDYNAFSANCSNRSNLLLLLNGSNHNEIYPIDDINQKMFRDKSIYIAKVESRKNQEKYSILPNIDFYGKCENDVFRNLPCYKGEPSRGELMNILKHYGNLVLLSDGENGTPLVIKEALMAGLPVVTNKYSIGDLDVTRPFIDVIPDEKLNDFAYIENRIKENLNKQYLKYDIRQYAMDNFSWEKLVKEYSDKIESL